MINQDSKTYMISTDGSLKLIPSYLQNEMQKRGWHIVVNPKREYFPEYDLTSPLYNPNKEEKDNQLIDEQVLEVEII